MPDNVKIGGGYISYKNSFRETVLSEAQVEGALAKIQGNRLAPSRETHRQHVASFKARSDPNTNRKCPKCGSNMVLRTTKRGENAGKQFWGCSAFPKCKAYRISLNCVGPAAFDPKRMVRGRPQARSRVLCSRHGYWCYVAELY